MKPVQVRWRRQAHKFKLSPPHLSAWPEDEGPVFVYLPPKRPSGGWHCGTEWIWEVVPEEVERITGRPAPGSVWVCEHQIDVD